MKTHKHIPKPTGRRITAEFNMVVSTGEEAFCSQCGKRLIIHDKRYHFAEEFTEIEAD